MKYVGQWFIVLMLFTVFGCASQTPQEEGKLPTKKTETTVETEDRHWVSTQDGCFVYSPNPIPNETMTWSGDCMDGKAIGPGELTWYLNGEATGVYTGEFLEGKPEERGIYKHLVPPTPLEQLPTFTLEELLQYDGQDGAPAYVGYNGKVYDVSHSFLWATGKHQMSHWAGEELTDSYGRSPHGFENLLEPYPIVGIIVH